MEKKTYDIIASGAVLVAVFSTVGFDKFPTLSGIFFTLAILAGVTSIGLYLINQYLQSKKDEQ